MQQGTRMVKQMTARQNRSSGRSVRFVYERRVDREDLRFRPLVFANLIEWFTPIVPNESIAAQVDTMEAVTLDLDPPFDAAEKALLRIEVERSTENVGWREALQSSD